MLISYMFKYMASFGIVLLPIYLGHVHSIAEVFTVEVAEVEQ